MGSIISRCCVCACYVVACYNTVYRLRILFWIIMCSSDCILHDVIVIFEMV